MHNSQHHRAYYYRLTTEDSPSGTRQGIGRLLVSRREEIIETQYNEIKQLESRYRKLYEGSPVMLRTINRDGIIVDCNQAYFAGLGYSSKDEVIGHSIFEHTPSDAMIAKRESFEEWRRSGLVKNKEVWFKRKDGSKFPALINANNLYDDEGNLVGGNTVITDLTEIHEVRRKMEKAAEEIKKAFQMKEEFIRIAAHELRTPIQPILLSAELARNDPAYHEKAWDIVVKEAKRLKRLANDILDVSRLEGGNLSYDMRKVRAREIIDQISYYARMGIQANMKGESVTVVTRLDCKGGDGQDIELYLDAGRIIQALENVIANSIKFTDKGEITIETRVLAYKRLFEIKISDTGDGISKEMLHLLFSKFATKGSGNHVNKQGTGLGLFISRSIVQAHGGDIFGYNNEDGKGATFVIRLPIFKEPNKANQSVAGPLEIFEIGIPCNSISAGNCNSHQLRDSRSSMMSRDLNT